MRWKNVQVGSCRDTILNFVQNRKNRKGEVKEGSSEMSKYFHEEKSNYSWQVIAWKCFKMIICDENSFRKKNFWILKEGCHFLQKSRQYEKKMLD